MEIRAVLKKNLSVTKSEDDGAVVYQVQDPQSGESFEFGEMEWFLLSRLNDAVLPSEIIEEFKDIYNTDVSPDQLQELVDMAMKWGLCLEQIDPGDNVENVINISSSKERTGDESETIKGAARPAQHLPTKKKAVDIRLEEAYGDPELSWTWFDPGNLFLSMSQALSPLRYIVYVLPLLVLTGILVVFNNLSYLVHDLVIFRTPLTILHILVYSMFTVNLITQAGRGVICRGLGMDVPGFGVRVILAFIPRFGVYTEGISRLSKRRQLFAHAGPLFIRMALFGCCSVLWIMTRSNGTHFSFVVLMIATVSVVSFILSVNPLINSSGYKILTTLFEIPNLRRKAYMALFKRSNRHGGQPSTDDVFALKLFAIASASFWILLIGAVAIFTAKRLETSFQGTGVVLFLILFSYFVISFRRRLKTRRANMRDSLENRPGARLRERLQQRMQQQAESDNFAEPEEIKSDKKKRRWLKYVVALALLIIAFLPYPYETGGAFTILPVEQEWIYAETEGVIKKVFHNGNQFLKEGEIIAKLSSVEQEQAVQTTSAAILEQKAELELLLTTPTKEDLDLAQKKLETAIVQYKYSKDSEARLKKLYEAKHISFEDYEDEKRKRDINSMQVEEAKANLAKVKAGPHPQEIEAARSELKRLEERLIYEKKQLEMTNLVMPIDGYLVTRNLKDRAGQFLDDDEMFAVVEDSSSVRVDIEIPEADISEVVIGAVVRLKVWTYPDMIFEGSVTEIDRTVSEGKFGEVVVVSAIIPNSDGHLRSGMTGFGKVDGGSKFVIVAFTRMLVRFFQIELWSWIP
jgi:putative peptide zinc metalloprotease protein